MPDISSGTPVRDGAAHIAIAALCFATSIAALWGAGRLWGADAELARLRKRLLEAEARAHAESVKRTADRTGRIRAEQELSKLLLTTAQSQHTTSPQTQSEPTISALEGSSCLPGSIQIGRSVLATNEASPSVFPLRPIAYLQSVFSQRNGTPRQPLLVPSALSKLVLAPDIPGDCLDGLQSFSHVWLLFVFHANTDIGKVLSSQSHAVSGTQPGTRAGLKAKIQVPRLDGGRMGVLATRSPHRPCPLGLSVAQVVEVNGRVLTLAGADLVDGSPILDIKPYLPFCDSLPGAVAPAWVQAEAEVEPLKVASVQITDQGTSDLTACWEAGRQYSLYATPQDFVHFVKEVLSRDIRSVHQRKGGQQLANLKEPSIGREKGVIPGSRETKYSVVLEGIVVQYEHKDEIVNVQAAHRLGV